LRNNTNKCLYRCVSLLYYKQRSLLYVSATYGGHLQGGVLWMVCCIECRNNLIYKYKMLGFKWNVYALS
jgi:hypothetical protein